MPGKSRRSKGKHPVRSKRKRGGRGSVATTQQSPVSRTAEPTSQAEVSASSPSVPAPSAAATTARYPYIVTELRRISVLAGIILVILVALALVLS